VGRDSAKIEYISGRQPSPHELAFGVELGPNPHFKTNNVNLMQFPPTRVIKTQTSSSA